MLTADDSWNPRKGIHGLLVLQQRRRMRQRWARWVTNEHHLLVQWLSQTSAIKQPCITHVSHCPNIVACYYPPEIAIQPNGLSTRPSIINHWVEKLFSYSAQGREMWIRQQTRDVNRKLAIQISVLKPKTDSISLSTGLRIYLLIVIFIKEIS